MNAVEYRSIEFNVSSSKLNNQILIAFNFNFANKEIQMLEHLIEKKSD